MSPVGVGIGLAIIGNITHETSYYMSVAVLQALAGGTILYVVAFEILERERSKSISGLVQLCFVIVGFATMMTVELLGTTFFYNYLLPNFIFRKSFNTSGKLTAFMYLH